MLKNPPPVSIEELKQRAASLTGKTLRQVAQQMQIAVPDSQKYAKGWTGELMESYLGATAASLSEPDFQALGIELKTIPVGINRQPKESTYVCTVPLVNNIETRWETSNVKRKLSHVLWLPIEADKNIELDKRRIGQAFLWQPDEEQENILKQDWQELMDMICMGEIDQVSSSHGEYLQIRPKAANAKALTNSNNLAGENSLTLPRGFYLRPSFTKLLLQEHLQ